MKKILLFMISFYRRYISPIFPTKCRYYPTCSQYTMEAIEYYGALKGFFLGLRRFLKCNPLFKGGYDPLVRREKH